MLVLDPNIKDMYFQSQWSCEKYDAGMSQLEEVVSSSMPVYPKYLWLVSVQQLFCCTHPSYSNSRGHCTRYVRLTNVYTANTFTDGPSVSQPSLHYSGSYLMNAVQAIQIQQQADTADGPRDELHKYLKSGAETTSDIVGWWGVSLSYL